MIPFWSSGGGGCQESSAVVLEVMVNESMVGLPVGASGREGGGRGVQLQRYHKSSTTTTVS